MSLRDKLIKNSTIELTETLVNSKVFSKKDVIPTSVPLINVALSGTVDGGIVPGLTLLCGPSKHFKSAFALLMAAAFLKKYPDGTILFYDSEFGTPGPYFTSFGIPLEQVVHTPVTNIEEFKFDVMQQLKILGRDDKVMIVFDSLGNLASIKEVEDAESGKSVGDMSRAKQIKSVFRMVTPHLTLKDIPMIVVNHIYMTQEMYSKPVVSGGTGPYLSADTIWIMGRQQDKDNTEKTLDGYHFIINIEKSRYVKEKSKFPITVSFDGGINRWSGLIDIAIEGEFVASPKKGYYCAVDRKTGELVGEPQKKKDIAVDGEFWEDMLAGEFSEYLKTTYQLTTGSMIEE